MNVKVPFPEAIDKLSILMLKIERLTPEQKANTEFLQEEYEYYKMIVDLYTKDGVAVNEEWIAMMRDINGQCWDLEASIRQGKEGELGLEEIGRRALKLRDLNKERIARKNRIAKDSGTGFFEIKINHASE